MYLVDTNVIIRGLLQIKPDTNFIKSNLEKQNIYISTITIAEYLTKASPAEKKNFDALLKLVTILSVDEMDSRIAAKYRKEFLKTSRTKLIDNLIAAQAKNNKLILITNNTQDFPMKDIKVSKPH